MTTLTRSQRATVARRYGNGESAGKLAREFGVVRATVYSLAKMRGHLPLNSQKKRLARIEQLRLAGIVTGWLS